ncbi:MAG: WbuC family cupin fold metalloprotein [Burkholderiales bacterium]|nr:WbuC family cupin fold metalloprotein [Burkholderiales bacterium]
MLITDTLIDALYAQAQEAPRRRRNRNLHGSDDARAHRLLNAVCPDSYVRPHRHLDPEKDETLVVLRGRFGLVMFDDAGAVVSAQTLGARGPACGATIAHGCFHSLVALEPGAVFFEAKAGPYLPLTDAEVAHWAPAEGDAAAAPYLAWMRGLFD